MSLLLATLPPRTRQISHLRHALPLCLRALRLHRLRHTPVAVVREARVGVAAAVAVAVAAVVVVPLRVLLIPQRVHPPPDLLIHPAAVGAAVGLTSTLSNLLITTAR